MKYLKLKHLLTVCTLIFVISIGTLLSGCNSAVGSPLSKSDRETLATAVEDMYNEKTLYVDGNFSLKQVRTTTSPVGMSSNSSLINCEFYGAAEYNEQYADLETFEGDAFLVNKETNESYGNAYYVRDGLAFRKFYNYYDKTTADLKKECETDNKSDIIYLGNLKEQLPYSLKALGVSPLYYYRNSEEIGALIAALLTDEDNEAVKNILHGYINGICELLVITKTEGNAISEITGGKEIYTLDIAKTYSSLFDKIADLVKLYYESSKLTIGELFDSKQFKAIASPLLKNIDAKDVIDILSDLSPYTDGNIIVNRNGQLLIKLDGYSYIEFDEPKNYTLEEYFKKVVLETSVPSGYASVKIKDLRVIAITGDSEEDFLPYKDSNGRYVYPGDDVLEEIEEAKNEMLDTLKTAKVSFTVENKKITHIKVELDTVETSSYNGGSSSGGSNYGGSGSGYTGSSMNYSTTVKTTFTFDVSLEKKAPTLIEIPSRYLNYYDYGGNVRIN